MCFAFRFPTKKNKRRRASITTLFFFSPLPEEIIWRDAPNYSFLKIYSLCLLDLRVQKIRFLQLKALCPQNCAGCIMFQKFALKLKHQHSLYVFPAMYWTALSWILSCFITWQDNVSQNYLLRNTHTGEGDRWRAGWDSNNADMLSRYPHKQSNR